MTNFLKKTPLMLFFYIISVPSFADSLTLGYEQITQRLSVLNKEVQIKPAGGSLSGSFSLTEQWQLSVDYQRYQDAQTRLSNFNTSIDLMTLGAGLNYYLDDWSFSLYYNRSTDDISFISNQRNNIRQTEQNSNSSLSASADYAWSVQNWFYDLSFTSQYNGFTSDTIQSRGAEQGMIKDVLRTRNTGDYMLLSGGFSISHLWTLTENRAMVVGGLFTWSYQVSGNSQLLSRNGRTRNAASFRGHTRTITNRTGSGSVNNALIGDDNYGQVVAYVSYDLSPAWSLEFDSAVNVATASNDQSNSINLTYLF